jgi:hypothetical protein
MISPEILSVIALIYFIVQLIIGSGYYNSCIQFIPIGLYLILSSVIFFLSFIANIIIGASKSGNAAFYTFASISSIVFLAWTLVGFYTVWQSNLLCYLTPDRHFFQYAQASTIVNLIGIVWSIKELILMFRKDYFVSQPTTPAAIGSV